MAELSIAEALQAFMQNTKLKHGLQAAQIETLWEELMGKTIAKYTDKIKIINKTLFIYTNVAPLKNELLYQKEEIIKRVNEVLGKNTIEQLVIN